MVPIAVLPVLAQYPEAPVSTEKAVGGFRVCRNEKASSFPSIPAISPSVRRPHQERC